MTDPPPESDTDPSQRLAAAESSPEPADSGSQPETPPVMPSPPPAPAPLEPPATTDATPRFPLERPAGQRQERAPEPEPLIPTGGPERTEAWYPMPPGPAPSFHKVEVDDSGMPRPSKKTDSGRR